MGMVGSNSEAGREAARPSDNPSRPAIGILRRVGWCIAALPAVGLLVVTLGFAWFIWHVPANEVVLDRDADGIVVLTGGGSRGAGANELLAAGHGGRLLFSGGHRSTTRRGKTRLHTQV